LSSAKVLDGVQIHEQESGTSSLLFCSLSLSRHVFTSASLKTPTTFCTYGCQASINVSTNGLNILCKYNHVVKMRCNSPSLISRCKKKSQIMSATWINCKKRVEDRVTPTSLACWFPQLRLLDTIATKYSPMQDSLTSWPSG